MFWVRRLAFFFSPPASLYGRDIRGRGSRGTLSCGNKMDRLGEPSYAIRCGHGCWQLLASHIFEMLLFAVIGSVSTGSGG